jgi:general secretion pathway protein M
MLFLNREISFGDLFSGKSFLGESSLNREQLISVAAFATLVLICIATIGVLFEARAVALRDLTERRDGLERLQARVRQNAGRPIVAAPPAAFIEAPTQGLASAALQAHLAELSDTQHAGLVLSGEETAQREDAPDAIRLQATLDMNMKALRALLYQLESGTPYVFVDALAVQPASVTAGRAAEDPLLRATLSLRAFWRKGTP